MKNLFKPLGRFGIRAIRPLQDKKTLLWMAFWVFVGAFVLAFTKGGK